MVTTSENCFLPSPTHSATNSPVSSVMNAFSSSARVQLPAKTHSQSKVDYAAKRDTGKKQSHEVIKKRPPVGSSRDTLAGYNCASVLPPLVSSLKHTAS